MGENEYRKHNGGYRGRATVRRRADGTVVVLREPGMGMNGNDDRQGHKYENCGNCRQLAEVFSVEMVKRRHWRM